MTAVVAMAAAGGGGGGGGGLVPPSSSVGAGAVTGQFESLRGTWIEPLPVRRQAVQMHACMKTTFSIHPPSIRRRDCCTSLPYSLNPHSNPMQSKCHHTDLLPALGTLGRAVGNRAWRTLVGLKGAF